MVHALPSKGTPARSGTQKGEAAGKTVSESYSLEYGEATLEIHTEDLPPHKHWLIVDNLIATGGTLEAVAKLVERQGSTVAGIFGVIGLPFLNYAARIGKYNPKTLIEYRGE